MTKYPFSLLLTGLFTLAILAMAGCRSKNQVNTDLIVLEPYQSVDKLNDTTFFGPITDLHATDSHIFLVDHFNCRILVCDHQLNYVRTISGPGRGPGELTQPSNCVVSEGILYVRDNKELKKYSTDGLYLGSVDLPSSRSAITAIDQEGNIYGFFGTNTGVPLQKLSGAGEFLLNFGVPYEVSGSDMQQRYMQARNLFLTPDHQLVALGTGYPSLELYDLSGKIHLQEIIDDPLIERDFTDLKQKMMNADPNTTLDLFTDVCLFKNRLFTLDGVRINDSVMDVVIEGGIAHDRFKIRRKYQLQSAEGDAAGFYNLCVVNDTTMIVSDLESMSYLYYRIMR